MRRGLLTPFSCGLEHPLNALDKVVRNPEVNRSRDAPSLEIMSMYDKVLVFVDFFFLTLYDRIIHAGKGESSMRDGETIRKLTRM